jgi:hypothetical protein
VVVCIASVVVVGGCAAAKVARLGGRVVRVLGTAVHRCPSNVVVKNPAGRFDMAKIEAAPGAVQNRKINDLHDDGKGSQAVNSQLQP